MALIMHFLTKDFGNREALSCFGVSHYGRHGVASAVAFPCHVSGSTRPQVSSIADAPVEYVPYFHSGCDTQYEVFSSCQKTNEVYRCHVNAVLNRVELNIRTPPSEEQRKDGFVEPCCPQIEIG
jgi:hypothetical protein